MWLMLGFHQQFLNATPKTAESEHDEMVRWSRCLKVQTGTKPEIQLEVTKLLSGEYTFKTCPSPGIRLFEGGEAGSAQLGTLEPVSEMQISQVWFDNCKAPNDNFSMHVEAGEVWGTCRVYLFHSLGFARWHVKIDSFTTLITFIFSCIDVFLVLNCSAMT